VIIQRRDPYYVYISAIFPLGFHDVVPPQLIIVLSYKPIGASPGRDNMVLMMVLQII
jgi:hypothetical protein